MNAGKQELKVQRVSTRKRTRDSLNSNLTPAKKRGTGPEKGMLNGLMADENPTEYCSDNEDLFGDYDSILGDSSLMAKLDCVEQIARKQEPQQAVDSRPVDSRPVDGRPVDRPVDSRLVDSRAVDSRAVDSRPVDGRPVDGRPVDRPVDSRLVDSRLVDSQAVDSRPVDSRPVDSRPVDSRPVDQPQTEFTELRLQRHSDDRLTDSIMDVFKDKSFEDLPAATQFDLSEDDVENMKMSELLQEDKTSTPLRIKKRTREGRTKMGVVNTTEGQTSGVFSKARRSMTDQLKRAMLSNARAPSSVSCAKVLKEAVVTEEINVAMQAMETVSTVTTDLGPFFGLPTKVKELIYKLRGINDLYDWQKTCLNLDSVRERRNLIYSLPTSGGKTLVAEILILKELLCRKKDCLFILPYISLVQEKVRGLAGFGLELDFMVEEYAGSKGRFPPVKRRNNRSLYIATIEKGHSLVNSLIENGRLDNMGLVVVDELHMLGDGSRGAIIEMTLAKVLYMSNQTQIIGMSATLGNIKDIQTFLRAENYTNDFRPVQLSEYVKLSDTIYEVAPQEEDCLKFSRLLNFKMSGSGHTTNNPDHKTTISSSGQKSMGHWH